jgi:hypothetical protein
VALEDYAARTVEDAHAEHHGAAAVGRTHEPDGVARVFDFERQTEVGAG